MYTMSFKPINYLIIIKFNSCLSLIASIFLITIFFVSFTLSLCFLNTKELYIEWSILRASQLTITLFFIFDFISLFFFSLVRLIAGSVILFRTSYIKEEKYFSRFIFLVIIFVLRIYLLILRPNIISILLGWDGLGVTSYLLVIYYQSTKSYNAGILTAITNRLGDIGILIAIGLTMSLGSFRFSLFNSSTSIFSSTLIFILVVARITKRAQVPFSAWLPAAMAAPTPVSALVHSSTLVTAGVYLLIRFNNILATWINLYFLAIIGVLTIVIAGGRAIFEIDIKKIIALSTLRQLGVIITALGWGFSTLAYFHLLSHAYFKAILFICAGLIIHNIKDYQDLRAIGIGLYLIPLTIRILITSNISLCGIPFIRGFYSKDLILEIIIIRNINLILGLITLMATALTVAYSCRLSFIVCLGGWFSSSIILINEKDFYSLAGIFNLYLFSIFAGNVLAWILFPREALVFIPHNIKFLIIFLIMATVTLISFSFLYNTKTSTASQLTWFFSSIWHFPNTFSITLTHIRSFFAKNFLRQVEFGWTEKLLFEQTIYSLQNIRPSLSIRFSTKYILSLWFVFICVGILYTL